MANDPVSNLLFDLQAGVQAGWAEARAEYLRRTTPISYWRHLYEDFNYSPVEFYQQVNAELEKRLVPDLIQGFIQRHEGTVFSRKRLYLDLRRERFVFEICAAPFGTGWFVSSRLFDRRKGADWKDFLFVAVCGFAFLFGLWGALGTWLALALFGTLLTLVWSVMRLAASESVAKLDDRLCDVPFLGRLYETLFHPETYFRQDQRAMYEEVVHRSVMKALEDLTNSKGIRPLTESEAKPMLYDLHRR